MKLISISKTVQNLNYKSNIQNYKTWSGMAQYFDNIFLIVVSPDNEVHTEQCDNINITWIPFRGILPFMILVYKCAKDLISINKIDVIDLAEPVFSGIPGVLLKRKFKIPLVTQIQGQLFNLPKGDYTFKKRILVRVLSYFACSLSDHVRAVTNEIADSAIKNGINKDKITVSLPRCDTKYFSRELHINSRHEIRSDLGCDENTIVLLFIGRLIKTKGVSSIIEAMSLPTLQNNNYKLLIVGDGSYENDLKEQVKNFNIDSKVCFYGRVSYDFVPKMLTVGDIFIAPSIDEALARSVLEAMSMCLPVIVTPVGGNREIIKDGVNGMLVEVNNAQQIADCVDKLSKDMKLRNTIGTTARNDVIARHDYEKNIRQFAEIYRKQVL